VPFFIRPISRAIANRLAHAWLLPNARQHLAFLADLLARPPAGAAPGPYLCGSELTSADVLLSFPLLAAPELFDGEDAGKTFWDKDGGVKAEFRTVFEYVDGLKQREAWKRADARFAEALGTLEGGQTEGETARW
jgi:glutathione S-transferase